jgi:putative glutamine amidotransferase
MSPPVIGICAVLERARWGPWDQEVAMVPRTYVKAVQTAGPIAVLLPPDRAAEDDPASFLRQIDALLLAGGYDIDPGSYGAEPHAEVTSTWPDRDRFELALCRAALDRGMPVLGVCRGMQLLNVARGGTLIQHLPDVVGSDLHCHTPGAFGDHEVRLEPDSLAARAVGAERTIVKSHHHQGVDRLGDGLIASGWSVPDDVVEAIELDGPGFGLGVLWHPEEDERSRVIGAMVEATQARASTDRAGPAREAEEAART